MGSLVLGEGVTWRRCVRLARLLVEGEGESLNYQFNFLIETFLPPRPSCCDTVDGRVNGASEKSNLLP